MQVHKKLISYQEFIFIPLEGQMQKFELMLVRCKMCDFAWEITPQEKSNDIFCKQCGSKNLSIQKQDLHMLKKGGKFITDIGYAISEDKFGELPVEKIMDSNQEPLLVVKENDIKISKDVTNKELKLLLGRLDSIRNKIIDEVQVKHEELMKKLM